MSDAGTYRVDVTNVPGGCPDTWDDVTVAVVSKPATPAISSANVSGNSQDVCSNTSATYSINPPAGGSSYIWSVSGGGVLTHGSPSNQASINWSTSGGPYQVSVTETSSQGCKGDPVLLNVTVHDPPAITSLDTTGATNGQSNGTVTVNSPGATEYSLDGVTWQASPSFSGLAASPPTYTAYTRNSFGCVQTQTFTINNIIVGLTLNADTAQGCPLTTISISVYATGMNNFRKFNICLTYDASLASFDGIRNTYNSFLPDSSIPGQLQITWESPTDVSIPDGTLLCILDFRGKKSGFSIVTYDKLIAGTCGIFDGTGMSYVIAFKDGGLDFLPQPDANIIGDTQLCEDEAMNLYAIGDATQRTWTLPDGSSDTNQLITRDPVALADSGTYMLLTKNSIGCINRDTVKVIVRELPEPELTGGVSPVCVESVTQGLNPGNFTSYEWSDGSTAPILTISHEGIYWVIVTDEFGCKNIDTTELVKCPTSILVPTAFSPNGDGANDRFRAHYTDTDILENYKLLIYDRWGRLMFETNDIMQSWDGTYDGKICPVGAYTYVISFKKPFGKTLMQKLPYRGIVNLIR
jgi:gliding motility-associated-like protein